jgi:hypothetical protein
VILCGLFELKEYYVSSHTGGGKKKTNYTTTTIEERNHKTAAAKKKKKTGIGSLKSIAMPCYRKRNRKKEGHSRATRRLKQNGVELPFKLAYVRQVISVLILVTFESLTIRVGVE